MAEFAAVTSGSARWLRQAAVEAADFVTLPGSGQE
jgi:hypothetical protein